MFKILFACTGNRCRSPYAQAYFARLAADLPVEVLSAGTLDAPGKEVPAELIEIGRSTGLDLAEHRSQHLSGDAFPDIDLFIGFERGHVASAVVDAGVPYEKAFTLPEIVRLLSDVFLPQEGDVVERARAAVATAAERRQQGPDFVPGEEVADPFRQSADVYKRSATEMGELCDALYRSLFGDASRVAS